MADLSVSNTLTLSQAVVTVNTLNITLQQTFEVATVGYGESQLVLDAYGSIIGGNEYFGQRLRSEPWVNATNSDKEKALVEATEIIDQLNFLGQKSDPNQIHQFPRYWPKRVPYPAEFSLALAYNVPINYAVDQVAQDQPDNLNQNYVPIEIEKACYEIALKLLDGYDPDFEQQNLAVESQGYSNVRETYDRSFVPEAIREGVLSQKAWNYLKPLLVDPRTIRLRRVD